MKRGDHDRIRAALDAATSTVVPTLADGCSPDMGTFLELAFRHDRTYLLARDAGVRSPTLASRFDRAGLPSPREYIISAQLIKVSIIVEACSDVTVREVAGTLDWASPQSLGRSIRMRTGRSALEYCAYVGRAAAVLAFRSTLIAPHLETLGTFRPFLPPTLRERAAVRSARAQSRELAHA